MHIFYRRDNTRGYPLQTFFERNDFPIFRKDVWTDEQTLVIIIFELEHDTIPYVMKRFGPPITSPQHSAKFTNKYIKNKDIFSGPWIHENGRWVVEIKRDFLFVFEINNRMFYYSQKYSPLQNIASV